MVDKKTKNQEDISKDPAKKSLYRRVFSKNSQAGDFQGETVLDLQPWTMTSKIGNVSSGLTLRVRVKKAGFGKEGDSNYKKPTDYSLNLDIGNSDIRNAFRDIIELVESQ